MHDQLQRLAYADTPNYMWFHLQLKAIATRNRFLDEQPFDWEPGGESYESCCKPPPPKKRKKRAKKCPKKEPTGEGEEKSACLVDEKK